MPEKFFIFKKIFRAFFLIQNQKTSQKAIYCTYLNIFVFNFRTKARISQAF